MNATEEGVGPPVETKARATGIGWPQDLHLLPNIEGGPAYEAAVTTVRRSARPGVNDRKKTHLLRPRRFSVRILRSDFPCAGSYCRLELCRCQAILMDGDTYFNDALLRDAVACPRQGCD